VTQYLAFKLGAELYGIDLLEIQEIRGYSPATPLPNSPPHFRGVMNLRGVIVPVVDLRSRFGLSAAEPGKTNVIVVVTAGGKTTGLLVDAVADVMDVASDQVSPPPAVAGALPTELIRGVVRTPESLVVLLDLARTIASTARPLAA